MDLVTNLFINYEAMVDQHDDNDSNGSDTNNGNAHPFKKSGISLMISDFVVPNNAEYMTDPPWGS